ncbi:MAG: transporter substrate-binding domain-containing protein [Cocleimonas sp.]|nr:transporter substrate-binding domain-containing protein [Cocleimonas sp.]
MKYTHFFTLLCLTFLINTPLYAKGTLEVGIKHSEPWVMYDINKPENKRNPIGFSIDLWKAIAVKLDTKIKWVYYETTPQLIAATKKSTIDVGIAAITVTSERQAKIDFSDSMYELGLQIMVAPDKQRSNPFFVMLDELKKLLTINVLLILIAMLFLSAHLRLLIDRLSKQPAVFPSDYFKGITEAFWWGLTMLVTWETPRSRGVARVIDLSWHLTGLIMLSILTAVVTSALTAKAISGSIRSEADLPGKRVAAIASDAPRLWLESHGITVTPVQDMAAGIKALQAGTVEALVHDGPRLSYLSDIINAKAGKTLLAVMPASFNPQIYGIAFPENSKLREPVNRILLNLREPQNGEESAYQVLRNKWIKH